MNLARYLSGCARAIGRQDDWHEYLNLTRRGLQESFLALALTLPGYYVGMLAVVTHNATEDAAAAMLPLSVFAAIVIVYMLTFSASAYILAMIFDRQDRFKPWVIIRHWAVFFGVFLAAIFFGLNLMGVVPYALALGVAFMVFIGSLVVDIRLAQKIVGFDWMGAIYTGCIIAAMGISVIGTGVLQMAGG
ncbi:MAG: hypothetical protein ACPGVT_02570 [Maricaulaceae bacterium]